MNKKVIAMAIAATMAAPMAAQAEDGLKVSGRVQLEATDKGTVYSDAGQSRLQLDYGMGAAYARVAWDMRRDNRVAGKGYGYRDYYLGYKFGDYKVQYGAMGAAAKNIEGDKFIATFLESRRSIDSGSGGFTTGTNLGVRGKMGDMKIAFDMETDSGAVANDYMGLSAKTDTWYFGYASALGVTAIKAGMTFGAVKVGYDDNGAPANNASINVGYAMDMAGGSLDVTFGTRGNDATAAAYRVAWMGKMAGGRVHAGVAQNMVNGGGNVMVMGAGFMKKF